MRNRYQSNNYWSRACNWLVLMTFGILLAACGGGGGDPTLDGGSGSSGGTTGGVAAAISVGLYDATDKPATILSSTAPLTARALVTDKNGAPVASTIVTFASDPALATLSTTNGTALTDAKGYASITITALNASVSGAGKVTATAGASAAVVTGETSFTVQAAQATGAKMTLSLLNGSSASNALTSTTPLTAKAVVSDLSGKPISGALVMFSTDSALATLSSSTGTALTDGTGTASVILNPSSVLASGAGTLQATTTTNGATAGSQVNYVLQASKIFANNLTFLPSVIAAYGSATMSVDIRAGDADAIDGVPYTAAGVTVRFSSPCILAGKASVTADAVAVNGKATAVYRDLGCGSDMINAMVVGSDRASHATLAVGLPVAASIQLTAVSPTAKSIVIKGQGGLLRTETASLTFRVFDTFNKPLAGQEVTFSLDDGAAVTLNKLKDTTDANGEVITTVNSGNAPTTFRVKATLKSMVSTYSDSILVTTGKPVQTGFSISVGKPNVEGWSYDSPLGTPATTVTVLLADQAGNPVPDGTPVAFQTSLAAIGSSSMGGCITANGGCSVDFRSQEPREVKNPPLTPCNDVSNGGTADKARPGLALICASTTDGSKPLFVRTAIFLSGSHVTKATLFDVSHVNGTDLSEKTPYDLGTVKAAEAVQFRLRFSDENENPMPSGSTVAIANQVNGLGSIAPSSVQNIFPHNELGVDDRTGASVAGNQGSSHAVTISSLTPTSCTGTVTSTFNVTVTTPLGNATSYPFKLTFSCP